MTREETAELVGRYFGLQWAGNAMPRIERGEEGTRMLNALRDMIDFEMAVVRSKLPPGMIDAWPRDADGQLTPMVLC